MARDRQVLLKNRSKQNLNSVEAIQLDLYWLAVHHPEAFKQLCDLCHGHRTAFTQEAIAQMFARNFLEEGGKPYDDVIDVVQSGTYQEGHTWKRCNPLLNPDDGEH